MNKTWTMPLAIALAFAAGAFPAVAIPVTPQPIAAPTAVWDIQLAAAAVRGPRGGVAVRGNYGGAAVRGPRGGVAVRGPYGGAAVRGPYRGAAVVGGRYHGGVWYGTGRRYWGGRYWPYGVGSCWRPSPIGYVWVCG
jgi:hypothetical protein